MADTDLVRTVVTKREETIPRGTVASTPSDMPADVRVIAMHWSQIVLVRALRTYVTVVLGLMSAAGVGADKGLLPNEFIPLLLSALQIGLAPVVYSMLMNVSELLGKVDVNFPQMRA